MQKNEDGYYPHICGQLMNCVETLLKRTKDYTPKNTLKRMELEIIREMARKLLDKLEQ